MNLRRRYLALLLVAAMVFGAVVTYAGVQILQPGASQAQDQSDDQEQNNQEKQKTIENLFSGLQKNNDKELSKVNKAYSVIKEKYVQDVEDDQLIEGAINGMLETLDDPYSVYMDEETVEQFESTISSSFEGIGTEVSLIDGKVTIVSPFKGSPAEKAGLKPKDQIVGVDGENIVGMDLYEAVFKIRGEKGTTVSLEIDRPGVQENLDIDVKRDTIPIETVYSETKTIDGKKAGVLEITSFAEDTAKDFNKKLDELEKENIEGLVIDVRGNPGGLFTAAQEILENFVPEDEPYVQIENSSGEKQRYFSSLKEKKDYPVVVLMDEGSASASEIMASAMKEAGGYEIVGKQSFGKGTVQQPIPMGDGSNLKLTIYKWLTPDGNWIHKEGIEPTVKAELPEFYYMNPVQIDKELKYDQNSEKIANVQIMLEGLGFDPGRKDGYFSNETVAALRNFQQDQGLEVTGTVNEQTGSQLQSKVIQKVQNNEEDTQMEKALEVLINQ